MNHPFLTGERLYLRGLERADLSGPYFQWLNDHEVTRYLETGRFPNSVEAMDAFFDSVGQSPSDVLFAIVLKEGNRHIGNVKLGSINWFHRFADFGILVGARECWGKGYGLEATRLILAYGFQRLNLHKITLGVIGDHASAIRSYERAGFRQEGRITSLHYVDGQYRDKVLMGVTRDEFELPTAP